MGSNDTQFNKYLKIFIFTYTSDFLNINPHLRGIFWFLWKIYFITCLNIPRRILFCFCKIVSEKFHKFERISKFQKRAHPVVLSHAWLLQHSCSPDKFKMWSTKIFEIWTKFFLSPVILKAKKGRPHFGNAKTSGILWILAFKNLMKIEFWWRQIFEILIIHEPSLGSLDVPQKIWARSVQPFWRLLDTNKQTNRQTDKQTSQIYI